MIVSIHQPNYIPWLGLFYKAAHSDVFVYLDDAQFSSDAAHNYNMIKTPQGGLRLKIPVDYSFGDPINRVRTKDELGWKRKHLKTLEANYARAPYFTEIFPGFSEVLNCDYESIAALNMAVNGFLLEGFGIATRVIASSGMALENRREQRIIEICTKLGAAEYLSGTGAESYQKEEHFAARGIRLRYSDYTPIEYRQCWQGFLPRLSALDYVLNCGFDWGYVEKAAALRSQN
jgi:hypothetical protein